MSTGNGGVGMNPPGVISEKDGVIIVDHGSRRRKSNLMLKTKTGYPIVEPAHTELAEPSIRDAFGACVRQGAIRVIVSPFFLFPGRHWHQDAVNDRIKYCLSHVAGDAEECAVCAGTDKCKLY
ncbi:hypothetical protein Tsubulata_050048 [Turnera subulata]|uniref:Sirohydrochlorin cobaltochelatase n=1 Tax=Turnera subulata TaxID=218843 RepID=A0A9Q0FZA7_9ROSI|nr:hypothetical protein Tsubulata_050048 [Turnera subulata]